MNNVNDTTVALSASEGHKLSTDISACSEYDSVLPEGWVEMLHDSGIRFFVHEKTKVVCWSRPYRIGSCNSEADFDAFARSHLPPLNIFRSCNENEVYETHKHSHFDHTLLPTSESSIKRIVGIGKLHETIDVFNTILVNGVRIENPEGKSAKALLRDYIVAALRCTPRYEFSKNDDLINPVTCAIYVHEKRYSMESRPSKVLAREAAVESALKKLIPDFQKLLVKKDTNACEKSVDYTDQMMSYGMDSKSMSLEDFKQLSMSDDRVLSACLALSIRTPAQVLQEYQNRNRGISVVYNTLMTEKNGCNSFKTVASCGKKAGEGVGSTKRISKQLAAQALLARLHERSPYKSYYDIADLYSSLAKAMPQQTSTDTNEIEATADQNDMQFRNRKRSRDFVDDLNCVVQQTRTSRRHAIAQEMSDEEEDVCETNKSLSHAARSDHNGRRVWIKHSRRPSRPVSYHVKR